MILAVTTADSIRIHEDQEFAQEVMDAVDICIDQGLFYGVFLGEGDDAGIYAYEKEQFLAMCEAESITEEELLANFLLQKLGHDGDYIRVVYLNIGEPSS